MPTITTLRTPALPAQDFSLLRRHTKAFALGQHVSNELAAGRMLFDVLGDEPVRAAIADMPCLLEDVMFDARVRDVIDTGEQRPVSAAAR